MHGRYSLRSEIPKTLGGKAGTFTVSAHFIACHTLLTPPKFPGWLKEGSELEAEYITFVGNTACLTECLPPNMLNRPNLPLLSHKNDYQQ